MQVGRAMASPGVEQKSSGAHTVSEESYSLCEAPLPNTSLHLAAISSRFDVCLRWLERPSRRNQNYSQKLHDEKRRLANAHSTQAHIPLTAELFGRNSRRL